MAIWDPLNEGKDHINIYSKSIVPLGRALSNFAHIPFAHPEHGLFQSVEGFYYWLLTGKKYHKLKDGWGLDVKKMGQALPVAVKIDNKFKEQIQYAIGLKVLQNQNLKDLILHSTLIFTHYYYFGDINKPKIKDMSKEHKYMIDACEQIRITLKEQYNVKHKKPV